MRRLRSLLGVAVVSAGACGEEAPPLRDITLHAAGAALVAAIDANGDATALPLVASGTYSIPVQERFAVAVVCEDETGSNLWVVRAAPDDEPEWFLDCVEANLPTATLTIVSADDSPLSATCAGVFGAGSRIDLEVPLGTRDLVITDMTATTEATRLLRQTLTIEADLEVTVDIADAVPIVSVDVVALDGTTPVPGASLLSVLVTANRTAAILRTGVEWVWLAPGDALDEGDVQVVEVASPSGDYVRYVERRLDRTASAALDDSSTLSLTLPSVSGFDPGFAVRDGAPVISFTPRDVVRSFLATHQLTDANRRWNMVSYPGWPDDAAVELAFPDLTSVEGWNPAWQQRAGVATTWTFRVSAAADDGTVQTIGMDEQVATP